jgi:NADP-dependent 3-hydroxy acid dehydrogenase YdfG
MSTLTDQVVIVTGASSGIGEATARELGRRGARVVCCARRAERLHELVEAIVAGGGHAIARRCDVTKRDEVEGVVAGAIDTWGRIDGLVNNAGVMPISHIDALDVDGWDRMIDVNIKGVLYFVAACLPHMFEAGAGHIVNISSTAGRRVIPGGTVYCATKHAVHAISEGLRAELATRDIRVTIVAPGFVKTELQSHVTDERILQRWKEASAKSALTPLEGRDIAEAVCFALEAPAHVGYNEILVRPTRQEG